MKISTRRIRERLQEDFPLVGWEVSKVRKKEEWRVYAFIVRNRKEYGLARMVDGAIASDSFVDFITVLGRDVYKAMEFHDEQSIAR